jgi:chromosome segregation protein
MRLLRLELQGFKSFLDRTILTFEPGITGVVGPNGCGKSNIVDAILWVMGEQSPKHLRGESMSDVIFNGSDSRAPTSMAEVSLIMERQGVPLAPQFAAFDKADEISITRRIYRDGTGEFLINKTGCRLKDIHELFMDTGVGRRAYSIIEQGQIDRMINVKPEDRRYLFEEVAGITKYKQKRKEAERKLDLTRQNILRLQDIIAELEKQIRSLKIQATKARKYKEIKSELEVADLHLLGRGLYAHQFAIEENQSKRDGLVASRSEMDALFAQVDAEVTELDIQRIDQEKIHQSLSDQERDTTLKIQKLESQQSLFEERKKFIVQSNEAIQREEETLAEKAEALEQESQGQETERVEVEHRLKTLEMELSQKEQELRSFQQKRQLLTQRKRDAEERLADVTEREIYLDSQRQHNKNKQEEIAQARAEIDIKLSDILGVLEGHRDTLRQTDERIEQAATRSREAEQEVAEVSTSVQTTSRRLSELEEELYKAREVFHSKNSRLESLQELAQNLEGYSSTAKEILLTIEGDSPTAVPLAEILQPSPELEDQLEILLGADMNTLLVNTGDEAEKLARLIEDRGLERVRIVPLSDVRTSEMTKPSEAGLVPALEKIKVRDGYAAAARKWLGNVYLCPDANSVLSLRRVHPDGTFFAPSTNIIAHSDSSITSGVVQGRMGVFARRREIDELTALCAELTTNLAKITGEREQLMRDLEAQEKRRTEMKDTLSRIHIESVEYRKEREKIQSLLSRADRDFSSLNDELHRNESQLEAVVAQSDAWDAEIEKLGGDRQDVQAEIDEIEVEINDSADQFEKITASLNDERIERSRLSERMVGIGYRIDKIKTDIEQARSRAEMIRAQRLNDEKELIRLEAEVSEAYSTCDAMTIERNAILVKISDVKAAFNETCQNLQNLREKKDELQDRRGTILEDIQELELKVAQAQSQFDQMKSICLERYHREPTAIAETVKLSIEQLPLLASQIEVTWDLLMAPEQETLLQEHVQALREKIDRYGEVNLTAIQEFEDIQKRYDFLMSQRVDLDNSIKILEEAIQKIDESTQTRFKETFDVVNQKFKEIFPILFNGGKAELALTNPENLLESGVDVMVQPPGKRLQSITLLSGGEKALTAVSLILAIFARKPSPFCLLDEVDAPLDDANVSRFNTVIRKMSEKTQFIVITHNKKTMEIAEALYGVTMERAGVSKMTSVRMN